MKASWPVSAPTTLLIPKEGRQMIVRQWLHLLMHSDSGQSFGHLRQKIRIFGCGHRERLEDTAYGRATP